MAQVRADWPTHLPCKIALVGEAPGSEEVQQGRPFVGPSGEELSAMLRSSGILRTECLVTNVFDERPPTTKLKRNDLGAWCWSLKEAKAYLKDPDDLWRSEWYTVPVSASQYMRPDVTRPALKRLEAELKRAKPNIVVALGGTAVGTGVNTHPQFASRVCAVLSQELAITVRETDNHFQAQNTLDAVLEASGSLRTVAVSLMKIANDIRWLGSGPRAGLGELALPEVQPGSSIMPGKVNPVIAESLIQVAAQVIGNDAAVSVAAQGGYFELNTMMPVAAHNLLESIELLAAGSANFSERCVKGLRATERGPQTVARGLAIATALAPVIGYDAATAIAKEAAASGRTVREVAREKTDLSEEDLDRILDPAKMTEPGLGE